jgi:hypothetical protein
VRFQLLQSTSVRPRSTRRLARHVANHLQSLALFSLPTLANDGFTYASNEETSGRANDSDQGAGFGSAFLDGFSQSDFPISSDYENTLPPFTDDEDSSTLETSIQLTHADNTTYRIRGIPLKCKKGELENLLRGVLRLDGTRGNITVRSKRLSRNTRV